MILHTVKSSPFSSFALKDCLKLLNNDDKLLLISDAVTAVSALVDCQPELLKLHDERRLFILKEDLQARGLTAEYGRVIDYSDFVNLTIQCQSQLAW